MNIIKCTVLFPNGSGPGQQPIVPTAFEYESVCARGRYFSPTGVVPRMPSCTRDVCEKMLWPADRRKRAIFVDVRKKKQLKILKKQTTTTFVLKFGLRPFYIDLITSDASVAGGVYKYTYTARTRYNMHVFIIRRAVV